MERRQRRRSFAILSTMKKILITLLLIALGAFLWWTISPLFIDVEVNDELPVAVEEVSEITIGEVSIDTTEPEVPEVTDEADNPPPPAQTVFPINDTPAHPATGNVRIVETPEEKIIRFEDYSGTNGPDLKIYLSKDLEAKEFIDLGPSRANKGNINYSVPVDVDISQYQYVLTWCEAFGVLFDYALINP